MKLVFIHGSGGIGELWHFQIQHFRDADALDLPARPQGKLRTSIEEYSDWLHDYIRHKKYKDVILAGHSLGGGIALTHAVKYPGDLRGIITIGSGARLRVLPLTLEYISGKLNDTQGWLKEMVAPLYATVDDSIRKMLLSKLAAVGPAVQLSDLLCCDKFDIMDKIGEIKMPALAIVGDQDNMTPPKYSQHLVNSMPNCKMNIIEGAGHLVFLEKPEQVNMAIEGFLKGIAARMLH